MGAESISETPPKSTPSAAKIMQVNLRAKLMIWVKKENQTSVVLSLGFWQKVLCVQSDSISHPLVFHLLCRNCGSISWTSTSVPSSHHPGRLPCSELQYQTSQWTWLIDAKPTRRCRTKSGCEHMTPVLSALEFWEQLCLWNSSHFRRVGWRRTGTVSAPSGNLFAQSYNS